MPGVFVTATGTEVGKTYVTTGLIRAGRRAGLALQALKPVLTGYNGTDARESDAGLLLEALGREITGAAVAEIAPWRFVAPWSPHMAAKAEGGRLDFAAVVEFCRGAAKPDRFLVIEGIGGVMVPLDESHTVLDLIGALALPVILVSGTQLGALSHCLTAAAVLRESGRPAGVIVLDESAGSTVPLTATHETVSAFCKGTPVLTVPRDAGEDCFDTLLQEILAITA